MTHPHEQYGREVLEMVSSLHVAVRAAGGAILDVQRLRSMTAEELILLLAPNGVRFTYQPPLDDSLLYDRFRQMFEGKR